MNMVISRETDFLSKYPRLVHPVLTVIVNIRRRLCCGSEQETEGIFISSTGAAGAFNLNDATTESTMMRLVIVTCKLMTVKAPWLTHSAISCTLMKPLRVCLVAC